LYLNKVIKYMSTLNIGGMKMKNITKRLSLVLAIILIFSILSPVAFGDETTQKTITILATSDLHGRIYPHDYALDAPDSDVGIAKAAAVIASVREEAVNVIVIDNGDTIQDNSAELFHERDIHPMVEAMNMIGYDVWTLGNHEFNFGLDILEKNIEAFEGSALSANIKYESTGEYYVDPYTIMEIDGVKVAIVGMIPPHISRWEASNPEHFEDLIFEKVADATAEVVAELEGQYDVLIGAYHLGMGGEYGDVGIDYIAENFPEFDAIIGGHAHSEINETINGVLLIEPKRWGNRVSRIDITVDMVDSAYDVVGITGENIDTNDYEADQDIIDAFLDVHEESVENANVVVGQISGDFIDWPDYITGMDEITTMPTSQLMDTSVIDLINEVQLFYTEADISSAALFNFGSNLKAGDFKKKDVAYIYKYDNTLMGVNITGVNLVKYMEWSASYYNTYKDGDVTISFNPDIRGYNYDMFSGCTYDIDISQEAESRIKNIMVDGVALDPEGIYKLAVNNYRFGTLLGLELVTNDDMYYQSVAVYPDIPDGRIRDMIIKYTNENKGGVLTPTVDNNWKIIGADLEHEMKDEILQMVRDGEITIPVSEDGRTMNVESLNVYALADAGKITLGGDVPPVEVVPPVVPVQPEEYEVYYVVSGDVLWRIAEKYNTTWQILSEFNNMENPNLIYPYQKIMVPK
jgi:2',3'-cyclic-nucleotide 2'-phosphodiesterase/3'-nucleotidase